MRFSVIVPVYNAETTIERCLKSIQNQIFEDFEALIINDGSSDGCGEICARFAEEDSRFRYFEQTNKGVSSARNNGIDLACGDYITFIDSDDFYFDSYLSQFADMIERFPECGNYWCAIAGYDFSGNPDGRLFSIGEGSEYIAASRDEIMDLHECSLDGSPFNKAYRRSLVGEIRMPEYLSLGEDLLFNFEYLDGNPNTEIIVNPAPQYAYCNMSEESLVDKYRDGMVEIYDEIHPKLLNYLLKWKVSPRQIEKYYVSMFYIYDVIMRRFFLAGCKLSTAERYHKANEIMKRGDFSLALSYCAKDMNPLLWLAYKSKNYRCVRAVERLASLKKATE